MIFIHKMEALNSIWKMRTPYVTEEAARGIQKYKYAGADLSLLYIHAWGPMAQYVTDHWMPPWVAYFL